MSHSHKFRIPGAGTGRPKAKATGVCCCGETRKYKNLWELGDFHPNVRAKNRADGLKAIKEAEAAF